MSTGKFYSNGEVAAACVVSCGVCPSTKVPTKVPTKSTTNAPFTSCVDNTTVTFPLPGTDGNSENCEWLKKNKKNNADRIAKLCF